MNRFCILSIIAAAALFPALAQNSSNPFIGRWDMTVTIGNGRFPSWLEVTEKSGNLEARVQQRTGNVAPVAAVKMEGPRLIVTVTAAAPAAARSGQPAGIPGRPEMVWELTAQGGKLTGVQKNGDYHVATHRREGARIESGGREGLGDPEPLFNGKDLTGWEPINNTPEFLDNSFHQPLDRQERRTDQRSQGVQSPDQERPSTISSCMWSSSARRERIAESTFAAATKRRLPRRPTRRGRPLRGPERDRARARVAATETPSPGWLVYGMLGPATPPPFRPDWQTYDITLSAVG